MSQPPIPLATLLQGARTKELGPGVLVIGRDPEGRAVVLNSAGTLEEILQLLADADDMLRRKYPPRACDLDRPDAVRQAHENGAKSQAAPA